jgi:RNA polymerase sigma-70 factor (ECF subfamily)
MSEDALVSKLTSALGGELESTIVAVVPDRDNDAAIIDSVCNGDSESFGLLVRRYEDFVYTLVRGLVSSDEAAEDVTQEIFLRAYRAIRRFEKKASFKTWLYRIAYNTSMSYLARKKQKQETEISDSIPAADGIDYNLKQSMLKLLNYLKPELKAVVIFHYYDDMKYEEIAEVLNCPVGTVKIRLYRAKHELKILWEKYAI